MVTDLEFLTTILPRWQHHSYAFDGDSGSCEVRNAYCGIEIHVTVHFPTKVHTDPGSGDVEFLFAAPKLRVNGWRQHPSKRCKISSQSLFGRGLLWECEIDGSGYIIPDRRFELNAETMTIAERIVDSLPAIGAVW